MNEATFWSKVDKGGSCWEWTGSRNGYGNYGRVREKDGRSKMAHREAWELVNGPIPDGMFVCHHCDNPPCVRPDHLFLGTPHENNIDCLTKGRQRFEAKPGEQNGRAILTEANVREIRRRNAAGESHLALAREFGVHGTTVFQAIRRITWKHVV